MFHRATNRSNGSILPNPSKQWGVREVAIYSVLAPLGGGKDSGPSLDGQRMRSGTRRTR